MNITIRQSEVRSSMNGEEAAQKEIAFVFNPDEIEMVRAKDGAYIIRQKRPRGEVIPLHEKDA